MVIKRSLLTVSLFIVLQKQTNPLASLADKYVSSEDVIIKEQTWWPYNDSVHVVAIIQNSGSDHRDNISGVVRLYYNSQVYYQKEHLRPDKTILAPGEETVLFLRWLPMLQLESGEWVKPSKVTLNIASQLGESARYHYIEPPSTRFVTSNSVADGGWKFNRVRGEFYNAGDLAYRAAQAIPNERMADKEYYPFNSAVVFFKNGHIAGADRPFYTERRGGHTVPGDAVFFRALMGTWQESLDSYRIFNAVEPLADGVYPLRWEVIADGWHSTNQLDQCGASPCPAIIIDFQVKNASDVDAYPYIGLVLRDITGRPITKSGCYPYGDLLRPNAIQECHVVILESEFAVGDDPSVGVTVDNIVYITIHVSSVETTTQPEFAAIPNAPIPCFMKIEDKREVANEILERMLLYLPIANQPSRYC